MINKMVEVNECENLKKHNEIILYVCVCLYIFFSNKNVKF